MSRIFRQLMLWGVVIPLYTALLQFTTARGEFR